MKKGETKVGNVTFRKKNEVNPKVNCLLMIGIVVPVVEISAELYKLFLFKIFSVSSFEEVAVCLVDS